MHNLLKIAILISLSEIGYAWQYPRNADQTLWAFRSCQKGKNDQELVKKWMQFQLPNDPETHCYIKCVWTHLGMYDENAQSIRVDKVTQQFKDRNLQVPAELSKLGGPTKGNCATIFGKTMNFLNSRMKDFRIAFYGTVEESNKWFSANPATKPKVMKISDFCKAENREGGKEGTCKHACSMYYYRLVDEDDLVIPFRKIPGFGEADLKTCRDKASSKSGCNVADEIYHCLNSINSEGLKEALNTFDEQSATMY